MVSHHEPLIEIFRRREGDTWEREEARLDDRFRLESIASEPSVAAVYDGVDLG